MPFLKLLFPLNDELIEKQLKLAADHPRRRSMHVICGGPDQPVQALLNTFMPDSYAQPHKHEVDEIFEGVSGEFLVILFNEDGTIHKKHPLRGGATVRVPAGKYHTAVCLYPDQKAAFGGTIYETKECYYNAETDKIFASWAPKEGTPEVAVYLESLKANA